MPNKLPIFIIILVIAFILVSLFSFITMEKASEKIEVSSEKIETQALQTSLSGGIVRIDIVNPNYEKKGE